MNKSIYAKAVDKIGIPRIIIFLFLMFLFVMVPVLHMRGSMIFSQTITRVFMNIILVLSMVPSIEAGAGINYGMPLGIICGLFGSAMAIEIGVTGIFAFLASILIALPFAILFGWLYAQVVNRVKGSQSMVATYVGFSVVSLMCIVWMLLPVKNLLLKWPMGNGIRSSVGLDGIYAQILDDFLRFQIGVVSVPTGLILFDAGLCITYSIFAKTHLGIAMKTAGTNPTYAHSIGISIEKSHEIALIISTCFSAVGIIVYSQSYGFLQFYDAPLMMAFSAAAAVLIGGASNKEASVANVLIGTFLFQSLLAVALPVTNKVMPEGNLSEILRIVISNGIILYALTKAGVQQ